MFHCLGESQRLAQRWRAEQGPAGSSALQLLHQGFLGCSHVSRPLLVFRSHSPFNSMGLAQRARRCETDAHGRAQSRHAAQHGDISARRQTVRIQSSDPTCKESASYLSFFCGVRRGRDTRGRLTIPDSDILALLPERVCKKRQMLESSGKAKPPGG